jgi:hypothetical protein
MGKRTTISIPDDLHQDMQAWKNEINFSKEFQKMVRRLIDKKKRKSEELRDGINIDEAIKRLQEQKKESEISYTEFGETEGYQWASDADYDELMEVLTWKPWEKSMRHNTLSWDPTQNELLGDYFSDIIDRDEKIGFEETSRNNYIPNEYFFNWYEGWLAGISQFWNDVKDKI